MRDSKGDQAPGESLVGTPYAGIGYDGHHHIPPPPPDYGAPYGERPEPEEKYKTCKFHVSILISGETEGDIQRTWNRVQRCLEAIEEIDDLDLDDSEMLDG